MQDCDKRDYLKFLVIIAAGIETRGEHHPKDVGRRAEQVLRELIRRADDTALQCKVLEHLD